MFFSESRLSEAEFGTKFASPLPSAANDSSQPGTASCGSLLGGKIRSRRDCRSLSWKSQGIDMKPDSHSSYRSSIARQAPALDSLAQGISNMLELFWLHRVDASLHGEQMEKKLWQGGHYASLWHDGSQNCIRASSTQSELRHCFTEKGRKISPSKLMLEQRICSAFASRRLAAATTLRCSEDGQTLMTCRTPRAFLTSSSKRSSSSLAVDAPAWNLEIAQTPIPIHGA